MRESEFNRLLTGEFGESYGGMVARGHHLNDLGDRTAEQALTDGVPARRVWEAICEAFDIPESRRLGEDIPVVEHPID